MSEHLSRRLFKIETCLPIKSNQLMNMANIFSLNYFPEFLSIFIFNFIGSFIFSSTVVATCRARILSYTMLVTALSLLLRQKQFEVIN